MGATRPARAQPAPDPAEPEAPSDGEETPDPRPEPVAPPAPSPEPVRAPRPAPKGLDAESLLDLATSRFERGNYDKAAEILAGLLRVEVDPKTPEGKKRREVYLRARPLYAACLVAMGKDEEADRVILEQYRDDPFYELPRGMFPQPVVDRFIEVEAAHREEIEKRKEDVVAGQQDLAKRRAALAKARAARLAELERMAAEKVIVTTRSRWIATVPFGIGQFQNDDLGWGAFFAVSEGLMFTTALVSFIYVETLPAPDTVDCGGQFEFVDGVARPISCSALTERFLIGRGINYASLGAGMALLISGIIEAQVSFEPQDVTKTKRDIPPPVTPDAIVTEEGAYFGLTGRF